MDEQRLQPGPESPAPHPPRRAPLNSVSTRIIFFVFLSTFLTALVVSWISIQTIHGHLRDEIHQRFPAVLEHRAAPIDHWLGQATSRLEERAAAWGLAATLVDISTSQHRNLDATLETALSSLPAFSTLAVFDASGEPLATAGLIRPSRVHAYAPRSASPETHVETFPHDRHAVAAVVVPLRPAATPSEQPVGHLIGLLRIEALAEHLALEAREGPGRLLLADRHGALIAGSDGTARPRDGSGGLPSGRLLAAKGALEEYTSASGEHVIGSAQPLASVDWLLVMEVPFEEAFAPVLAVVSRIFLSDLVIILVFSFLAYKITAAIMQPIEALSQGALRIAEGQLDHEIPAARSNDEIGLLTRTFNDMMRKLRRSQQEIAEDQKRLTEQNEELQRANEVLAQLSITDGLTKLHNHRYFQDHLTREIKRLSRTGEALSMILIDLDDFKRLNDRYGHAAGDAVLMHIATLMNDWVRQSDLLARYGGEEFVVLATGTDRAGAFNLAEKIRLAVEQSPLIVDDSMRPVRVTVSCGVAQYEGDRKEFFRAADRALYRAKAEGKNCVICAEAAETGPLHA